MLTEAAILEELGNPLKLVSLKIPELKDGQVLVDIKYSGVCHTQILEKYGHRGEDKYLPHCLGHEGSGIVREAGPKVTKVKPGDKVIMSWIKGSGMDVPGTAYELGGKRVNAGAITTFSRQSVISENRLTAVPESWDISMKEIALLGCAFPTGMGAVLNVAKPKKGESIAVFGTGGIGLFAIAGARISQCRPIFAVDINKNKLKTAEKYGATHLIDNSNDLSPDKIREVCKNGVDFAIESCGMPETMLQAVSSVRKQGGKVVIVGNAPHGKILNINPQEFNMGKSILGTWGGDSNPDSDFLKYLKFIASHEINLEPFTSNIYKLNEINDALGDMESGKIVRPLIDMG